MKKRERERGRECEREKERERRGRERKRGPPILWLQYIPKVLLISCLLSLARVLRHGTAGLIYSCWLLLLIEETRVRKNGEFLFYMRRRGPTKDGEVNKVRTKGIR